MKTMKYLAIMLEWVESYIVLLHVATLKCRKMIGLLVIASLDFQHNSRLIRIRQVKSLAVFKITRSLIFRFTEVTLSCKA